MKKWIYVILISVSFAGFFAYKYFKYPHPLGGQPVAAGENVEDRQKAPVVEIVPPEITQTSTTESTYVHKKYNFSFDFPSRFKTSNFQEGEGEQIIFNATNGDWFQIYITPWDEGEIVTPERIHQDLPDMVINNPEQVILGPKQKAGVGPHALIFFSKDANKETREVWFVQEGHLYQVTTYKKLDTLIGSILSTLVFK